MSKKLPFVQALAWIILSTLFISGGGGKAIRFYVKNHHLKSTHPSFYLSRILQTGPQKEALKTNYLAELMQISASSPTPLAKFNPDLARKRILGSPVVKQAVVKRIEPDTIYVDYTVYQPVAMLADFTNTALSEEGIAFPLYPFFTPKQLPEIYLGINQVRWKSVLEDRRLDLALHLLRLSEKLPCKIHWIDVSKVFSSRLAEREIVVEVEEGERRLFLRLNPKSFDKALGNYLELRKTLPLEVGVIDLRLENLGFLSV